MSDAIIDALVMLGPDAIARYSTQRTRCILSTKVGVEVLRHFGVDAEPLVVNVRLMNAAARQWVEAGQPGTLEDVKLAGVHLIEISEAAPGPGYSGHMVTEVPGGIVDLDLRQFRRPEKAIHVPDAASFATHNDDPWVYEIKDSYLWYLPRRGDRSYRKTPAWRQPVREIVSPLIRAMTRSLEAADA